MRCRTCNYLLWKLAKPACPECGKPFDWRTYRFRPNAIGLACPRCGHEHEKAIADEITCQGCGKVLVAAAMQVVPLTADPRDAEALPDIPVPPFKVGSRAWWMLLGLFVLELPGAAVPFVRVEDLSPLDIILMRGWGWMCLLFFIGPLVTAQTLRALLPVKSIRLELIAGYACATTVLAGAVIGAIIGIINFHNQDTMEEQVAICITPLLIIGAVGFMALNWRRGLPHPILMPMALRATYIPFAIVMLFWALYFPSMKLGWLLSIYVVAVYVAVLITVTVMCRRQMAWLRAGQRKSAGAAVLSEMTRS